jgi:inner membrane protein
MDSITHITLGACIGELMLGKKLGKKALFWGVIAQSFPDIDTLAALFFPADQAFLFHRGITHSLMFAVIIGLLLALTVKKAHPKQYVPITFLVFFFCFQLMLHDLLDTCNSYGTGLLEPFSHQRFSINLLYVADPLFTIGLIVATFFLIFKSISHQQRTKWAWAAIYFSALYLCFAGFCKEIINNRIEASLKKKQLSDKAYFSTPAPFNCMLWYIVAKNDSSYFTAYSSIWDDAELPVNYEVHLKDHSILKNNGSDKFVNNLIIFAGNEYIITSSGNKMYFNIPRFEQQQGWQATNAPFAFSYPLYAGANQAALLHKGRLAGWNKNTVAAYLKRIAGKEQTQTH